MLTLVFSATSCLSFFLYCESFVEEEPNFGLVFLFGVAAFFGLWAMTAQLCV